MVFNNISEKRHTREEEEEEEENRHDIFGSTHSLSHYESKNFKSLMPQIIASAVSALFHLIAGLLIFYSSSFLNEAVTKQSPDLNVTTSNKYFIAYTLVFSIPIAGIICAFFIDYLGRLNTLKLSFVPAIVGLITIASAQNDTAIIVGQAITGFGLAWGTIPATIYITEIAHPDIRGSLISICPAFFSLGCALSYFEQWIMNWRTVFGITIIYTIVAFVPLFFIPESPDWLIAKGRNEQAKQSLDWFNKYQQSKTKDVTFAQLKFEDLINEQKTRSRSGGCCAKAKEFLKPTGYKPFLILLGLFFFQQFSGVDVNIFEVNVIVEAFGNSLDLRTTSLGIEVLTSIANIYLLKIFCRRTLLLCGLALMAICLVVATLPMFMFRHDSIPLLIAVSLYLLVSSMSILTIPWIMIAELFPIEIRGPLYSIIYSLLYFIVTISPTFMFYLFIDVIGVIFSRIFRIVMFLITLGYIYVFVPETHKVKLSDLQKFFQYNNIYIKWVREQIRLRERIKAREVTMNNV